MLSFIKKHNTIKPEQFGFREKHSCIHAIAKVTEFMRKTVDQKYMGPALFIDLKKAFDTVDHSIVLKKLNAYGFRGKFNDLNLSYSTNRQQYVKKTKGRSSKKPIECGVPQGSVLGPLFS